MQHQRRAYDGEPWAPEEREHMEHVKDAVCAKPIMVVPTEPSADELNDAELRMALCNHKSPDEIVRDLQTILITKPPGRQTEVMSQWEYSMRHPPQSKPRSKRGQRRRRWG